MTYKKTWFSYVLWAVYMGICILLLAFMGYYIYLHIISSEMTVIGGLMLFPVTIGIYFIVKTISYAGRKKWHVHPHTAAMWEAFLVSLLMVFSVLYRLHYLLYGVNTLAEGKLVPIEDMALQSAAYQQAQVGNGIAITGVLQEVLYRKGLSVAFSFLGNKVIAAMVFQMLLQVIALILGYVAVRKMAGRIPALVTLMVMAFSNSCLMEIGTISSGSFSFVCYLFGLLCVAGYVKSCCSKGYVGIRTIGEAALLAIVLGFLVYMDMAKAVLMLFLIGIFTGYSVSDKSGCLNLEKRKVSDRVICFLLPVLFAILVWGSLNLTETLVKGGSFFASLFQWGQMQYKMMLWHPFYYIKDYGYDMPVMTAIVVFAAFLLIEFFRSGKEQNYMLWIILALGNGGTIFAATGISPTCMLPIYCWAVLAGLGLQNCVCERAPKLIPEVVEETISVEKEAELTSEVAEKTVTEKKVAEVISEKTVPEMRTEEMTIPKPPVQLIENPLPLPKKHVKKEMEFEYPVQEDKMEFDIEVDDTDDFDV